MKTFKFTNRNNGHTKIVAVDNVSRKFTEAFQSGAMSLREYAFYLDGKSMEVHKELRRIGIKEYDELIIEVR